MKPKRFFTSDHHFAHANILKYEPGMRVDDTGEPFADVEAMDAYLIARWNDAIGPDDEVYVLGDFSFRRPIMAEYLPRLNGRKHLVVGNHDPWFKRMAQGTLMQRANVWRAALETGWASISRELTIEIPGLGRCLLNHFPYAATHDPRYPDNYSAVRPEPTPDHDVLLHGHVHSRWKLRLLSSCERELILVNLSVEAWGLRPASEDELVELVRTRAPRDTLIG